MNKLDYSEQLKLKRYNTPTIYNGLEKLVGTAMLSELCNQDEVRDFMPGMGSMIGYAVTVKIQPGEKSHAKCSARKWEAYREYVASLDGPKIVVVQDLDRPLTYGAFWGEVNSNVHRALGCVGTITDGAVRDIDEMTNAGFKAIARRLCVGHAYSTPVEWGCEVFVFGTAVRPGQLIHADKHGFIIIPGQCEDRILDAAVFMDHNECNTLIKAARLAYSKTGEQIVAEINSAARSFGAAANEKFK